MAISLAKKGDRFYHRQFLKRKLTNHNIITHLEDIVAEYFKNDVLAKKGLPGLASLLKH